VKLVDPVREAERILRGRRRFDWLVAVAVGVTVLSLAAAATWRGSARPVHRSTTTVVLRSGESSSWCAEAIAQAGGSVWSTASDSVDRLHLPVRGRLHVIDGANAVFRAERSRIPLVPAMPCTPG
jgi:hypothetical protein